MSSVTRLQHILESDLCTGCGLCEALAPQSLAMEYSSGGFLRPAVLNQMDESVDRIIQSVCPGITLCLADSVSAIDVMWGPVAGCYTGHASDDALRHHASSGGVISALAQHILRTGFADRVLQIKASDVHPAENDLVVSKTDQDVWDAAGSRYAPSAPLSRLIEEVDKGGRFAVIGKPCDIAGVRNLMRQRPDIAARIPYLLSFFCGGVPSTRGAAQIMDKMGVRENGVVSFRYRGDGWPGFTTAVTADGQAHRITYAEAWGGILSHVVQFRCKICPDGTGEFADVSCADAWHGDERGYPAFSEGAGRSLIIARTKAGKALIEDCVARGLIVVEYAKVSDIEKMQPAQARRKRLALSRIVALGAAGLAIPDLRELRLSKTVRGPLGWEMSKASQAFCTASCYAGPE